MRPYSDMMGQVMLRKQRVEVRMRAEFLRSRLSWDERWQMDALMAPGHCLHGDKIRVAGGARAITRGCHETGSEKSSS